MADYFWTQCDRPLMVALVGAWMADNLERYFKDKFNVTLAQSYGEMKQWVVLINFE
jgi:hypothetical protein